MMPMLGRIGQQFGSYELVQFLGRGGFAEVYLGKNTQLSQRLAAVKVLEKQLVQTKSQQFKKEAGIVATLRHPHIVQMYDYNLFSDVTRTLTLIPYIVMEYAPNGSLRKKHSRGIPLTLTAIATYTQQIADALQYAHDNKVMHLDVKPENILVNAQDQLLLSDFGLATLISEQEKTGDIQGTLSYMSPEQLNGKPDFASDQYALGVMVYEWVCGSLPFTGQSIKEVIDKHLKEPPPSLCAQVASLSPGVEAVVMKALSKNITERYARVIDFAHALQQEMNRPANFGMGFATPPNTPPDPNGPGNNSFSGPVQGTPFVVSPPVPPSPSPFPPPVSTSPFLGVGNPQFAPSNVHSAPVNPYDPTVRVDPQYNSGPPSIPSYLRGTGTVDPMDNSASNRVENSLGQFTRTFVQPVRRRKSDLFLGALAAYSLGSIFIGAWMGHINPSFGNETAWWGFIISLVCSLGMYYLFSISGNKFLKGTLSALLAIFWGFVGNAFATLVGAGTRIGFLPDADVMSVLFLVGSLSWLLYLTLKRR